MSLFLALVFNYHLFQAEKSKGGVHVTSAHFLPLTLAFCSTHTLTSSTMIHCLWKEIVYENQRNRNRERVFAILSVDASPSKLFSLCLFLVSLALALNNFQIHAGK
jgi:hypothetical protein